MALEADSASTLMSFQQTGDVYILPDQLIVYPENFNANNCNFVYNAENYDTLNDDERNYVDHLLGDNGKDQPMQYLSEFREVDEGLAVLKLLYNNPESDKPEFIDINDLTETNSAQTHGAEIISSDEDDVIFVGEYKPNNNAVDKVNSKSKRNSTGVKENNQDLAPRRNPMRKVRNTKASFDLAEELYEENFILLQQVEDDFQNRKVPVKKSPTSKVTDSLKEWPVNVYERPEYNTVTKEIENFDYTIRQIQKSFPQRRSKVVAKKNIKKKYKRYGPRKRRAKIVVEKKFPIKDLMPIVDSTMDELKEFVKSRCEVNIESGKTKDYIVLLQNQTVLCSVVNDAEYSEYFKLD